MKEQLTKVGHFLEDFGQPIRYEPVHRLSKKERYLKVALLVEELTELATSLGVTLNVHLDTNVNETPLIPSDILNHLADLGYVYLGAVCTCGMQDFIEPAFDELHRSNMSKHQPDGTIKKNFTGKVMKSPLYTPPDYAEVIRQVQLNRELRTP